MRKGDCFVKNNSTSTDTIESKAADYTQLNKNIERLEEAIKAQNKENDK